MINCGVAKIVIMSSETKVFGSQRKGAIKWAHNLAHKKVQNVQLKQWMQCMQCEFY